MPGIQTTPTLIDQTAAAELLGLRNPKTLAIWRVRRQGPAYCKIGSNVRYSTDAIASYIAANTVTPPSASTSCIAPPLPQREHQDGFSTEEVAKILGVSQRHITRLVKNGSIKAFSLAKRGWLRVPASEIERISKEKARIFESP